MTREEAIKELEFAKLTDDYMLHETADMAIKALKQEPCGDCVSRVEVKKIAKEMYLEVANMELDVNTISDCISYTSSKCREVLERKLQTLPPVTPTHKKGKWICVHHMENKITYDSWKCSECQHDFDSEEESMVDFDEYKYCPNCGAKMEVNEE